MQTANFNQIVKSMIHDGLIPESRSMTTGEQHGSLLDIDRRCSDRLPFPAELVLAWMHDLSTPVRVRILDAGDGGFRIQCKMPIIEGMTGIAIKLLPNGSPIQKSIMVSWVGRADQNGEREVGLRYF